MVCQRGKGIISQMKKFKFDILLLVLTGIFIVFTVGFFWGRNSVDGIVIETTMQPAEESEPSAEHDRDASSATTESDAIPVPEAEHAASNPAGVNINTATAEELEELPGIGPALARSIIEYRETYGPFNEISDIMNVSGIGEKKFEVLKPWITVR